MLKFVTGTAGTGKSKYIAEQIAQLAKQGEKCLLIVPEQFSKTGENMIFSNLDHARANLVQVFSFTSLLADVQSNHTKLALSPLSAAGKAVMARRAMRNVEKMMKLYTRQIDNFNFSYTLTGTFDDLKRSGYSAEDFFTLVQQKNADNAKLSEISLLYTEYTGLLGDKFCDHEDLLVALGENLPDEYIDDVNIFIDGFESFSFGQKKIIEKMLSAAKCVTIALVCDSLVDTSYGTGYFSFVQAGARDLQKSLGVKKREEIHLDKKCRFLNDELANIDAYLQDEKIVDCENTHAFIHTADTQSEEVAYVIANINNLVKNNGYSYSEIALVCPQLEKYENQLQESFSLAGIPYFIDSNRIISSSAPVVFFGNILNAMVKGLDSETIIPLLKTGLTSFDDDDIRALENYFYTWQEYDFDLSAEFTFSSKGLQAKPDADEDEKLAKINHIRQSVYDLFKKYGIADQTTVAGSVLENCYAIARRLGAEEKATMLAENFANQDSRELFLRQWDAAIQCLNELYTILSDDVIKNTDLQQLYNLIVGGVQIGFAPETQDCVMISQPKRMRLDSVKAVFIMGAAQDYFPAAAGQAGLINSADRESLEIKLNSDFDSQYSFENLYFYKALTTAREYLFITCSKKNIDLKQKFSRHVDELKKAGLFAEHNLSLEDYAITREFFADFVSSQINPRNRHSFIDILSKMDIDIQSIADRQYNVQDTSYLEQILGPELRLAPSRAERFFTCPFMYFMESVMKIQPVQKAEFSNRIAGNYLHFVAQQIMSKYGEDFYTARWSDIEGMVKNTVTDFLDKYYPAQIVEDPTFTALFKNMEQNAVHLMKYIYDEQQAGKFRPIAFEQDLNADGMRPLRLSIDDDKSITITGICDRVDIFRSDENDYLRIVDYKTGTKDFKLDDVYNGTSLQLLVYMNALLENQFGKKDKPVSAGAVLYQNSDASPKFDKDDQKLYNTAGMAKADSAISKAFDDLAMGRFGVIKGSDKLNKADDHSEIVEGEIFDQILDFAKEKVTEMGREMYKGHFDATPIAENEGARPRSCTYCRYKSVCMNTNKIRVKAKNTFKR